MPTITENLTAHLEAAADALNRYSPPCGQREDQIRELRALATQVNNSEVTPHDLASRLDRLETEVDVIQARHDLAQARQYTKALPKETSNDGGLAR